MNGVWWWWERRCLKNDCSRNKWRISFWNEGEEKMSQTSYTSPSLLLHQWMSSSIIMHSFVVLLLCQCMNSSVYGETISLPPLPLCLSHTLSLSLFLLFHIFKCQLYLCGLPAVWSFDVFSFSVSGFCMCEWELISNCSFRCFFFLCSSKS